MMKYILKSLIMATLLSLSGLLQAAGTPFTYNYLDVGLRLADRDGIDATGIGAEGSFQIQPRLRVKAIFQYLDADDFDGELEDIGASIGYYTELDPQSHFVFDVGLMYEYFSAGNFDDDDTGIKLDGTLRHQLNEKLEFNAGINYIDIFDDDDIGILLAGIFQIAPKMHAQVRYESIFETDTFSFGVRMLF